MSRQYRAALLVLVTTAWPLSSSYAQDSDKRAQAEALNEEGRERIKQLDLEGGAARFRAAMQLVNDPRYAFNLCYTLDKSGKLQEARTACQDVVSSGDERLSEKAAVLLEGIEARLAERQPVTKDVTSPDPAASPEQTVPPIPPSKLPEPVEPRFAAMAGFARSDVEGQFTSGAKSGLAVGGTVLIQSLPAFKLAGELQFVQRGFESTFADIAGTADVSMNYIDAGFMGRYHLGQENVLTPYLEIGTVLCVLLNSSVSFQGMSDDGDFKPIDLAWVLGAGMQVGALDLRVRLMYGLLDIAGGDDGASSTPITHRLTTLQAGYWF